MAGSHGGSHRWRRLRSGEENRGGGECFGERMRTRESEEERQGGAWRLRASRRKQEVAEASWARATPRLCPSGEGGRRQGEGWRWAGLARWGSWARLWWAARVRPGSFLLSLSLFYLLFSIFVLFYLIGTEFLIQTEFENSAKTPLDIFKVT